jgi:hypothetical protein
MKMKFLVFLVSSISILFFSCVSGPKSIKFDELSSKTFTLNDVTYMTNMDEFNKNIPILFVALPIQYVIKKIESEYAVKIDTSLFENSETTISKIKSYDFGMPNYFVEYDTDAYQKVSIFFGKYYQEKELEVTITLSIYEDNKIVSRSKFSFFLSNWSPY